MPPFASVLRLSTSASHRALTALCVAALLLVAAVALSRPAGYRLLVDHSDSMRPAIAAGDVLLTRMEPAAKAAPGDIVTFQDPAHRGRLLTHRVVSRRPGGRGYEFVTRGDANTGSERWSIPRDGRVGRHVARVPRVGYAVAHMGNGPVRTVLVLGAAMLVAARLARRVWRM
jgi:signal peptidase I